jgi:hypothetical protein
VVCVRIWISIAGILASVEDLLVVADSQKWTFEKVCTRFGEPLGGDSPEGDGSL